jgi:hypothetical protein
MLGKPIVERFEESVESAIGLGQAQLLYPLHTYLGGFRRGPSRY